MHGCGVAEAVKSDKVKGAKDRMKTLQYLGFNRAAQGIKQRVDPIVKKAQISALGFIEIKPEKIKEFLERKAAEYNTARGKEKKNLGQASSETRFQQIANTYGELAGALIARGQAANTTANTWWNKSTTASTSATATSLFGLYDELVGMQPAVSPSDERIHAITVDLSSTAPGTIGRFEWLEEKVEEYAGIPPQNVLEKFADVKRKNAFDYYTVASVNSIPDPLLLGRIFNSNSRYFIAQWGKDVCLDDVI